MLPAGIFQEDSLAPSDSKVGKYKSLGKRLFERFIAIKNCSTKTTMSSDPEIGCDVTVLRLQEMSARLLVSASRIFIFIIEDYYVQKKRGGRLDLHEFDGHVGGSRTTLQALEELNI
jgi:hypothetical protein